VAERIRVAVVFGGRSAEHSVSLQSARFVLSALDPERFAVVPIGIARDGRFLVGRDPLGELQAADTGSGTGAAEKTASGTGETVALANAGGADVPAEMAQAARAVAGVDVVFPVLHGPFGEDGTLQGFLEIAGVPYVGAGVLGSAVSMDKAVMKMVFAQEGLPITPYCLLQRGELGNRPEVLGRLEGLRYPLFVKPANLGSSVGISRVADEAALFPALTTAAAYDRRIVVEQGVSGRELECGVLGNADPEASVVGEVLPSHAFYDWEAKYDGSSPLRIPADIPPEAAAQVRKYAVRAFRAVDGAGMARVDFFLEQPSGRVFVNEINTIPGFTRFSMFPLLWQATGVDFAELCSRLVELALQRAAERNRAPGGEPAQ